MSCQWMSVTYCWDDLGSLIEVQDMTGKPTAISLLKMESSIRLYPSEASGVKALLLGGKEFIKQIEDSEINFAVIRRPKAVVLHTQISDLPEEV